MGLERVIVKELVSFQWELKEVSDWLEHQATDKRHALRFDRLPSYNTPPCEAAMPFSIRLFRRFPVQCVVSYSAGPFTGVGTVWNLSRSGWRLSGDLPMRPGESLSLTVTLPNEQRIDVHNAVVRWSRGQEFGVETVETPKHTGDRLIHYVRRLVNDSA